MKLIVVKLIAALTSALLAVPFIAEAQHPARVWRIGLLDYASDPAFSTRWKSLRDRLRELGYAEGQNVTFESRLTNRYMPTSGSSGPAEPPTITATKAAKAVAPSGELTSTGR